jgi:hypothetical protein
VQVLRHFFSRDMELKSDANISLQCVHRTNSCGVNMIKRRDFLKIFIAAIVSLFGNNVSAGKQLEPELKEAMFWRQLD